MDATFFANALKRNKREVLSYLNNQAPGMVIRQTLRFIDDNFRRQSWQGAYRQPWRKSKENGTTLVKTGRLRRSFQYTGAGAGAVRFYSDVPYANAHNRGFRGTVSISAHTRSRFSKSKQDVVGKFTKSGKQSKRTVYTKTGESEVKAHTRKVKVIKRQFAPYEGNESQKMNDSIRKEIETEINKILKL